VEALVNAAPLVASTSRLRQLLAHWSAAGIDTSSIDPAKPPELVLVRGERLETWKLRQRERAGADSLYVLLEVVPRKGAGT
jgi:hypothetical protein